MSDIQKLRIADRPVHDVALALAEEVLARVKSGETTALATVEVHPAGDVEIHTAHRGQYHHLNSGCARLAAMMASETD